MCRTRLPQKIANLSLNITLLALMLSVSPPSLAGLTPQQYRREEYQLGDHYLTKKDNNIEARKYLTRSALLNYAPAEMMLGALYNVPLDVKSGLPVNPATVVGVVPNEKKSIYYLREAASHRRTLNGGQLTRTSAEAAAILLGHVYHSKTVVKLAKQGDPKSETMVGIACAHGYGVNQNYAYALYWWGKAAQKGYAHAEYEIGNCYRTGNGESEPNMSKALYWYRKAAAKGYARAEYQIGNAYAVYNTAVPHNLYKAAYWWKKSAEQGDDKAEYRLGNTHDYYGIHKNYPRAAYWWRKAAKQGYAPAENSLGEAYLSGHGLPHNPIKALYWLKKAAAQDYRDAKTSVYFLEHGS